WPFCCSSAPPRGRRRERPPRSGERRPRRPRRHAAEKARLEPGPRDSAAGEAVRRPCEEREDRGWHTWQKAAEAVEAVRKDITVDAKGSVKNGWWDLPKEGSGFGKAAREFCERLVRGQEPMPSEAEIASAQEAAARSPMEHPYLRSMQYRKGGYAILLALRDAERSPAYPGFSTIKEVCRLGQKYCDDPMEEMGSTPIPALRPGGFV
ncbi:unnamed protein product, partial [Prorocentrum cordatum]